MLRSGRPSPAASRKRRSASPTSSPANSNRPPTTRSSGWSWSSSQVATPEVAPLPAQSPEELVVLLDARVDHLAVGRDQLGADQVVAGEAELGGEVADATTPACDPVTPVEPTTPRG